MKLRNSNRGQGSLTSQFLFDMSKLVMSVAVVLFSLYVISTIIIFFWPAPDVNLMAVGSIANTVNNGVRLLNSPDIDAVVLPVAIQFTKSNLLAKVSIKAGGTYSSANQADTYSEITPKMCLYDVSNNPLDVEINCVNIDVSKKLYVKYFERDTQFTVQSEVEYPITKFVAIRKESDGYEIKILHSLSDAQSWSAQYSVKSTP